MGSQKAPESGTAEPISLVSADLDGDGYLDLIGGYADSAGTRLVVFHNTGSASNILREIFRLDVPVRPDFMSAGDFTADGFIDLVVAARGDKALYFLEGNGPGVFGSRRMIPLTGRVTALA